MNWITDPEIWIALATLTVLEIVLGIDNIIFISILSGKLPQARRKSARQVGLVLAMLMRIGLLFSLSWLISLTAPLLTAFGWEFSGRDLILLVGGLFLIGKATFEIHERLEGTIETEGDVPAAAVSFGGVLVQISLMDVIFSLDSVITAVGMTRFLGVMVAAVMISVVVMILSVHSISEFVENHPTVKMLALSFLLLIGFSLVAEGLHQHIPKGYIYFAMGFSVFIEMLNLRWRGRGTPVRLKQPQG